MHMALLLKVITPHGIIWQFKTSTSIVHVLVLFHLIREMHWMKRRNIYKDVGSRFVYEKMQIQLLNWVFWMLTDVAIKLNVSGSEGGGGL